MNAQMASASFKSSDPIYILSELQNFRTARDSNGTQSGIMIMLFQQFIREPTKVALSHCVSADDKTDHQQEGYITLYLLVTNHLSKQEICS